MDKLGKGEIEFVTQCLKVGKPLPDKYRYIIPIETEKEYELTSIWQRTEGGNSCNTMAVPFTIRRKSLVMEMAAGSIN